MGQGVEHSCMTWHNSQAQPNRVATGKLVPIPYLKSGHLEMISLVNHDSRVRSQ